MKKGLVNLSQGTPEQLTKLKSFLLNAQVMFPEQHLKTHADAVVFAIQEASKVPELEKDISKLENGILDLSNELGNLTLENEELKKRIKELEDTKLDLTSDELEALFNISNAVDDSDDPKFYKNCSSGAQKLYQRMKKMGE